MIDWLAFLAVAVAALVSTSVVVSLFAFGLRLLNVGLGVDAEEAIETVETTDTGSTNIVLLAAQPRRPRWATIGAVACFALCVAAILYGIYLIVPFFHH